MKTMEVKTPFGTYKNIVATVSKYRADDSLAVQLWDDEGPFATLTVCLSDPTLSENEAYIDTNNCPWAMQLIETYELGWRTYKTRTSGWCMYEAVEFDLEKLKEYTEE